VPVVIVSAKGRVVIPGEHRCKYGIKAGDWVHIVDHGGLLAIVPFLSDPVEQACGILKGSTSLTEAPLAERRSEREHEDTH
jgi:AbrB family looped-hinge helix DNA binding protein